MALRHVVRALAGIMFLVTTGTAQSAFAQNWDGAGLLRFGTFIQGSFVDGTVRETPTAGSVIQQSISPSAFGVGLTFGYDLRMGNVILGAEIDASFDHGSDKTNTRGHEFGVDYFATARARLGYQVSSDMLIYATAGLALLGSEYKFGNAPGAVNVNTASNKKHATLEGVVFGGGIEYDAQWAIWFVEYLHTDYDAWTFAGFNGSDLKYDASSDVIRAGLKFKIGHDHAHGGYGRGYGGHTPMK